MAQGRIKWNLLDGFYLSKLLRPILPWIEKEQNLVRNVGDKKLTDIRATYIIAVFWYFIKSVSILF